MKIDIAKTRRIISKYRGRRGAHVKGRSALARRSSTLEAPEGRSALMPILQDIQTAYGYVPAESVDMVAGALSIYPVDIYGILTFYAQFHLAPRGRHTIRVCQGTACHVMGGREILDHISAKLGIHDGETTPDGMFSLERVACLGCCGMAPVIMVDNDFHGRCNVQKTAGLLEKYRTTKTGTGTQRLAGGQAAPSTQKKSLKRNIGAK